MKGRLNVNAVLDEKSGRILEQIPMPPIKCLAFEGGGTACVSHAGAISVLEEFGLLEGVRYVSGVSGGAIAALGVCLGYTASEIEDILKDMPMQDFMPTTESWWFTPKPIATISEFIRLWKRYNSDYAKAGAEKFLAWLQGLVAKRLGNPHATNIDLDNRIDAELSENGATRLKKLYVGAVNLSLEIPRLKIFGSDSKEEIELAQMVFMSACHPCLWGAAEWNGDKWGDGGIKSILLMDLFDDDRFHPETPGRVNPEILGIKIDTQSEIDQIIWNKKIRVPVKTTSQFALQVAIATSHTIDAVKVQEARNIIALADGGVDRLSLKLPIEKRLELIQQAKLTAREYLENHMDAAYDIYSHADVKSWLNKDTTNLALVLEAYTNMYKRLESSDKKEDLEKRIALLSQIKFIEDFKRRKFENANWDGEEVEYPQHINIKPEEQKSIWHTNIRISLESRLVAVRDKIARFTTEYEWLWHHYVHKIDEIIPEIYYGWRSEEALQLLICKEYLDALYAERDDLECKLGIKAQHHVKHDPENSNEYGAFYQCMEGLNAMEVESISYALAAIRQTELPFIKISETGVSPYQFQLDLRRRADRELFVLAMMIYLEARYALELPQVKTMAIKFMPNYKEAANNVEAFVKELGLSPIEAHMAMFKLEGLLHSFEKRERPRYEPSMSTDALFSLPAGTFFTKPTKPISIEALKLPKTEEWARTTRERMFRLQEDIDRITLEKERLLAQVREILLHAGEEFGQQQKIYVHGSQQKWVHILAAYDESIKQFKIERDMLACQLHIECHHAPITDLSHQAYATFFAKMIPINADNGISYGLRAVMLSTLPIVKYFDDAAFSFDFHLDLRQELDRKIYLLAGLIYLEWRGYSDTARFKEIVQIFMPGLLTAPTSRDEMLQWLGETPECAEISMFKIECLMRCFYKNEYPGKQIDYNLDDLFKLPRLTAVDKPLPLAGIETEMKPIYKISEARRAYAFVQPMACFSEKHDEDGCGDSLICRHERRMYQARSLVERSNVENVIEKVQLLMSDGTMSYGLRAVITTLLPYCKLSTEHATPFASLFNMAELYDAKLCLLAGMIYLEWRGYKDAPRFLEITQLLLPKVTKAPKSREELIVILEERRLASKVSARKIEGLLQEFQKAEYPGYAPTITLNAAFGLPNSVPSVEAEEFTENDLQP